MRIDLLRRLAEVLADPDRSWALRRELVAATLVVIGLTAWLVAALAGAGRLTLLVAVQLALPAAIVGARLSAAAWPDLSRSEAAIAGAVGVPAAMMLPGLGGAFRETLGVLPAAIGVAILGAALARGRRPRRRRGATVLAAGLVVAGVAAIAVSAVTHGPFADGGGSWFVVVTAALLGGGAFAAHAAPVRGRDVLLAGALVIGSAVAVSAALGGASAGALVAGAIVAGVLAPVPALGAGCVVVWREHAAYGRPPAALPAARVVRGAPPPPT